MFKIATILKAWVRVLKGITSPEDKRRAKICEKCPEALYKRYYDFVNDDLKQVKGFVCGECSCPLIAKIRSEDTCRKWE